MNSDIKWVIQNNLINKEDSKTIQDICIKHNYDCELVTVIPFDNSVPDIANDKLTIFYGATNFINNIYESNKWNPGTFFNKNNFTMKATLDHYKGNMLNSESVLTTLSEFSQERHSNTKQFFVRPNKDLKEFNGSVMYFGEIVRWEKDLRYLTACSNHPLLNIHTEILVAEPYNLAHEWRLFVINGKVCSGSHYRKYMKLDPYYDLPDNVVNFVETLCKTWTPSDVFCMDVCECGDELYVVECGCFNSCGFYKSDIENIIVDISNYILNERN